ncbi:ABC transporter substrate-binding protein [Vibrio metschnikovii]|uniref:ABC transporter substrate-binding protein n=4 Tax=Unclassified Bacteria TaxID=49928 RepID=A0AAU6SUI9_UNCXX|nr:MULTISPECIES: ABC transporter substrate-binding protein [Vibrio]EEX37061.1 ABC-type dipeptide transport system component [Vibrio metschnikovii CIP 69.14]EKO3574470.1 ABC transporter substrate-binding protein [Vibrio metschnikovii]EKO3579640.1 ABC transporter substrate-binding protein [Vibrio metschnikovii]EKO3599729.1 ABC transporter substrate-binding protein [Vibrio metschnikovii]EKO3612921.1 ABC transporter substrate-binding protein [Vibrio metschnikovii]
MDKNKLLATFAAGLMMSSVTVTAAEIKQGGTLTVPIINTGFVDNFNPYTTKDLLHGVMFEPLMVFNNMTGKTDFRLAKSYTYSDDLKTITLKLRDGLQWSDGAPLTADDVVYSFMLTKDAPAFDQRGIWSANNLQTITAKDSTTIVFELAEADSTFVWNLERYHIVPKHIWSKVENLTTFTNPNPVGSGPMTVVKYIRPQQMELCRNPKYYLEGRPYLDCINFRSYNDNSQIQPALMKGEIDWGSNFIADVESTFVGVNKANNHFWYPANDAIHLYMNTKQAPFNDLRVRQALSMALDREAIVDIAAYGYPTPNHNVGGIAELYQTYIDPKINEKYGYLSQYDVEKAKKLLDEAGIIDRNGDGLRNNNDGSTVSFDIEVVNGWTDWIQVAQMVSEYFEEIGIKANIKTVDWAVYDANLKEGKYSMSINWSMVATNPILAFQEYYHTSRIGKTWHAGHGINSPQIDQLIDSFGKTGDADKQREILSQLQKYTAENIPFIPLFSNPTWFQYSTAKIVGWPNAENPYVQPVWYDGGKRVLILNNLHLK